MLMHSMKKEKDLILQSQVNSSRELNRVVSIGHGDALLGQEINTQGDKQEQLFDKPGE